MLRGHQLMIEQLTDHGATLHEGNVGKYACEAVEENNTPLLQAIHNRGGDVSVEDVETGMTALHFAVYKNRVESVKHLLVLGASIDQRDKNGFTPDDIANRHNHTQIQEIFRNVRYEILK